MPLAENPVEDQYFAYIDTKRIPEAHSVLVERHVPTKFALPYHHHASVEMNFLMGCEMEYSFSGTQVNISDKCLTVFWGAAPHRVMKVRGGGQIINVYISFSQLLGWKLPEKFVADLIGGHVLCCAQPDPVDELLFPRWADDARLNSPAFLSVMTGEVAMRLRRFALEGWMRLMDGLGGTGDIDMQSAKMGNVEGMLRFISDNFSSAITVSDVADHVNLSPSYAMTLFRKVTGISIKEHITRTRLSHAQMLLSNSDDKILTVALDSGFGSISAFYEAFQARMHQTPAAFRRETRS